jgi:hypothetical protein
MNRVQSQTDARVTVARWRTTYQVPQDCSAPQDLQQQLDRTVEAQLAEECRSFLEPLLDAADPAVWRIKELTLDLPLVAGPVDATEVSRNWGRRLAADLHSMIDGGDPGESILRFTNKAAFVAQFVFDVAEKTAWRKWYYEEFDHLRILSDSQTICVVLLRGDAQPSHVIAALAAAHKLEAVLRSLSGHDARAIYEFCFDSALAAPRRADAEKWTSRVLELWNESSLGVSSRDEHGHCDALRLFGRTIVRFPGAHGDAQLKRAIDGLLDLRRVLALISSPSVLDGIINNLASGDVESAIGLAHRAGASDPNAAFCFFVEEMQGDADWGIQAAAVILGEVRQQRFLTTKTISEGESFLTPFGGVFLLGALLDALRLSDFVDAMASEFESPERIATILRHFVGLKCLGRIRAVDAADDPALRLFSGFSGQLFPQAFESLDAPKLNLAGAKRILLQTLLDPEIVHAPLLLFDLVLLPDGNFALVCRELLRDEWLDVVPVSSDDSALTTPIQASLAWIVDTCGTTCETIFLTELLASRVNCSTLSNIFGQMIVLDRRDAAFRSRLAEQLRTTVGKLSIRLDSAEKECSFFSLSNIWPEFELPPAIDAVFSLIARAALKQFARKLPGFDSSSPEHLYQNFLAGISEIRWVDGRLEVRLPASPLSMILRMTGLQEQRYAPAWLKGVEVWLLPSRE